MNPDHDDNNNNNGGGPPLPDFRLSMNLNNRAAGGGGGGGGMITQRTIPAPSSSRVIEPDYLEYDPKGRGIMVTMFANSGMSYLFGIGFGGCYGVYQGLLSTPSSRFRIQINSVLNHSGRYGSKCGNMAGVFAVLYSIYEGLADHFEIENQLGLRYTNYPNLSAFVAPAIGATATCATYYAPSGIRAAALAGTLGFSSVAATYGVYSVMGIPYGYGGYLFF